jgi:hypothetical protein
MSWEKISKNRVQREIAGFFIIKPEGESLSIPLFCPLCKNAMRNIQDAQYYRKYCVCYECSTMYAEPNRKKWAEGWRPTILDT